MIKVNATVCNKCHDKVYSRARHDYRTCSCGNISIDGGFDYVKINCLSDGSIPDIMPLKISATKKQLYNDWNSGTDKFGLIREKLCKKK